MSLSLIKASEDPNQAATVRHGIGEACAVSLDLYLRLYSLQCSSAFSSSRVEEKYINCPSIIFESINLPPMIILYRSLLLLF